MANLRVPLASNQDLTADFFNASIDEMYSVAFQAADNSTTNNATPDAEVFSPDLTLPMASQGKYIFQSCLFYDTSATADIGLLIVTPFLAAGYLATWDSGTAITGTTNNIDQSAIDTLTTSGIAFFFTAGGVASGTVMCIRPYGYFENSTSSGYLRIAHRQSTAAAVNTTIKQGSWVALSQIG